MQLSDRALARRYALALYLSAAERGVQDKVVADLPVVYRVLLHKMPVFKHPRVSLTEKKELLKRLLSESVSPILIRFLELLIEKKRFALLPHLSMDIAAIHDERRGVVNAFARSAAPLAPQELERLKNALGVFSAKRTNLDVKIDPELLAGVVVRMGDWVLDGSLKGRLSRMKQELAGT